MSRLFEEVNRFFRERVKFTLTATLNQKLTNTEKENLIEKELAPKSTLRVKVEGIANPSNNNEKKKIMTFSRTFEI